MKINTTAKEVHSEIEKNIQGFRPWQYQKYNAITVNYNVILSDIETYWNTEARFREGFIVDDEKEIIYVPNFFTKVNGIHAKKEDYEKFVIMLRSAKNTFVLSENFSLRRNILTFVGDETGATKFIYREDSMKQYVNNAEDYMFAELSVKNILNNRIYAYQIDESYSTFSKLTSSKQKQLVEVMKKMIEEHLNEWNDSEMLNFINICLTLPDSSITLLNNFDYSFDVPKYLVITSNISKDMAMLLNIMNEMCMDVLLLEPNGSSTIEKFMDINELSLGYFVNDLKIENIRTPEEIKAIEEKKKADIERKKIEQKKKKKKDRKDFIDDAISNIADYFPSILFYVLAVAYTLGIIVCTFTIKGTPLLIGCVVGGLLLFIIACIFDECTIDFDFAGICEEMFIIVYLIAFICLIGKGIHFMVTDENFGRSTHTHSGFETIEEEEEMGLNEFKLHYRKDAVICTGSNKMHCYIENNADNVDTMYFIVKYKNTTIYKSVAIEPMNFTPYVMLDDTDLPVGTHELIVEFYKYDSDAEGYTEELLGVGSINLNVFESNKEVKKYKEESNLDYCSH